MAYRLRQTQWCKDNSQDALSYRAPRTQADGVDRDPNFVTFADRYDGEIAGPASRDLLRPRVVVINTVVYELDSRAQDSSQGWD